MNLKVSDAEFSLATDRMTAGVESLVDISRDYVAIVEELTSRGISSERFSQATASVLPIMSESVVALQEAIGPLVERTNGYIDALDADDADFD
ncbi:hypothetical protein J2S71_001306 [Olsenella profusa DSM 13989]|uniref:Uncharacterized protein n=1 Tax=Olsenella profusa F0195 TaxID=1125712 RepID=U2T904_9ACTN|nr:hypothetical protein [Olsenella profusa]ERL09514.1 hypothetical protein HMPREF1316_1615 [Olsenella profusa F0195]MDP9859610.1 hypothetical protein [Olsenella profusa DSM 13989]